MNVSSLRCECLEISVWSDTSERWSDRQTHLSRSEQTDRHIWAATQVKQTLSLEPFCWNNAPPHLHSLHFIADSGWRYYEFQSHYQRITCVGFWIRSSLGQASQSCVFHVTALIEDTRQQGNRQEANKATGECKFLQVAPHTALHWPCSRWALSRPLIIFPSMWKMFRSFIAGQICSTTWRQKYSHRQVDKFFCDKS